MQKREQNTSRLSLETTFVENKEEIFSPICALKMAEDLANGMRGYMHRIVDSAPYRVVLNSGILYDQNKAYDLGWKQLIDSVESLSRGIERLQKVLPTQDDKSRSENRLLGLVYMFCQKRWLMLPGNEKSIPEYDDNITELVAWSLIILKELEKSTSIDSNAYDIKKLIQQSDETRNLWITISKSLYQTRA